MADALIGYSGFVGSNLYQQGGFEFVYNSKNITAIRGRRFDRLVCAGVNAVKWWANQNPAEDLTGIRLLMDCLDEVEAKHFCLISTIDVYCHPIGVTELDIPTLDGLHAYGQNRLVLERWVAAHFPRHTIVRLPGLFGPGLKKNAIYDLMQNNHVELINPQSCFQWFPVVLLSEFLSHIQEAGISLMNISTEPIKMRLIQERFFPHRRIGACAGPAATYDMRTVHEALLGGQEGYHLCATAVLEALTAFLANSGAE